MCLQCVISVPAEALMGPNYPAIAVRPVLATAVLSRPACRAIRESSQAWRVRGFAEYRLGKRGAAYQRSTDGPIAAPTAAGIDMPSAYQTPRKGAAISGQCKA